jgi:hypothetical protein
MSLVVSSSTDKRNWNVRADAADDWIWFEMELSSSLSKEDSTYLLNAALHLDQNPPLPGPFLFSLPIGAGGYNGLVLASKNLWNSEKTAYDRDLKIVKDLRKDHTAKANTAIFTLEESFSLHSIARKGLNTIKRAGAAAVPIPLGSGDIFLAMMVYLNTYFAPNKPTDAEALILKLSTADFHDGRGIEMNATEFIETFDHLVLIGQQPNELVMLKYLGHSLDKYSYTDSRLCTLRTDTTNDAANLILGVPLPVVPRWRVCLLEIVADLQSFSKWDYLAKETVKTNLVNKKSINKQYVNDSNTPYCWTCGRCGHVGKDCKAKICVCGLYLAECVGTDHNVKDAKHDKARRDYVPRY